ncbi:MAG: TonB-dependent receptor [Tannerella sp.]|nr:TonB-dependent receptor [Tannerella sp.]
MTYAQKKISGNIKDAAGEAIIGATVQVKGTSSGTVTDVDGNFTLNVADNGKTLLVSYVGYRQQELPIDREVFSLIMQENFTDLDEVVVIGYGTSKKRDLTGAVSSVTAKELQAVPVSTVIEAMTGKMAGVTVQTTEGSPDAEMIVRVRGGGSITGDNTPLYIVDGFPVNSISDIAASDIATMDVLKDASSTAIYGARGANGVIIITTKGGETGKVTVNYNAYYGMKKIAKTMDVLDPYDYALWQYERAQLLGRSSDYSKFFGNYQDIDMYQNMTGNDWQDLTFGRLGESFNQNLSIGGGTDGFRYQFNYSHIEEKAIMQMSAFKRDNLSLKLTNKPHKRIQLDFSARWSQTEIEGGGVTEQNQPSSADSRLKHAVVYSPIPVANMGEENDDFDPASWLKNPLTALHDDDRYQKRNSLNLNGSAAWEIIDNLKLKTELGIDQYNNRSDRFYGVTTYTSTNNGAYPELPMVDFSTQSRNSFRNTNTLNYNFKKFLPESNNLNVLLGQEILITHSETLLNTVQGFDPSFDLDLATRLSGNGVPMTIDNTISPDNKLFSFFGRVNYDYLGKYLLSTTMRADGSSKFARGNRWGYFPSVSAGWRISDEAFMQGVKPWLYDLKFRASYGTAGNNDIRSGQLEQLYTSVSGNPLTWINNYPSMWNPSKTMANPDLKWETTVTRNVGMDFALTSNGRLNGSVEAYLNTTKDLLILFPISGTGYDDQFQNLGETQNKGVEVTLNYVAIDKKNYGLSLSANIGFNKGRINDLGGLDAITGDAVTTQWASTEIGQDFIVRNGGVVGEIWGYRNAGRYEVADFNYSNGVYTPKQWKDGVNHTSEPVGTLRPGSMKLQDIDGNGIIDSNDREVIGNTNPIHTGGFNINARAYGFDLSAVFNWSYGNDVYNANKIEWTSTAEKYNSRNMIDIMASGSRWTNLDLETGTIVNDPERLAAMNANTTMWSPVMSKMVLSDWAVEDGSFLRLNTLTLGYSLPASLIGKWKISTVRFYCSAYNVHCWTNYSGFDPEVSTRRKSPLTPGVDYSAYPKSRSVVFGINLTF